MVLILLEPDYLSKFMRCKSSANATANAIGGGCHHDDLSTAFATSMKARSLGAIDARCG